MRIPPRRIWAAEADLGVVREADALLGDTEPAAIDFAVAILVQESLHRVAASRQVGDRHARFAELGASIARPGTIVLQEFRLGTDVDMDHALGNADIADIDRQDTARIRPSGSQQG